MLPPVYLSPPSHQHTGSTRGKNETADGTYKAGDEGYHHMKCKKGHEWQLYCATQPCGNGMTPSVSKKPRPAVCVKGKDECYTGDRAYISQKPERSRTLEQGPFPDLPLILTAGGRPHLNPTRHHEEELQKKKK